MESYYYNDVAADSFGSAVGLARQSKKPIKNVYDWLSDQDAYTLHRRIVRRFKRRKTYSKGKGRRRLMTDTDTCSCA